MCIREFREVKQMNIIDSLISVRNLKTHEVKFFTGTLSALEFVRNNLDWSLK